MLGLRKAIKRTRVKVQLSDATEVNRKGQKFLKQVVGACRLHGDITTRAFHKCGQWDLLGIAAPCQDFSSENGSGRGAACARGKLTKKSIKHVRRTKPSKRPKGIFFENVANWLKRKNHRKLVKKTCKKFKQMGYKNHWKIVDTASHGVAQTRCRSIGVSLRKDSVWRKSRWPSAVPLRHNMNSLL